MTTLIGQTVSHYKILEQLGCGGMGVVYKAEDSKLKRTVALKFLPLESTRDARAKERFITEARAPSGLQHNNICTIHDIDDSADGQLFIVMDCYDGETLDARIQRHGLSFEEIRDLAPQISRGLNAAHKRGIVHRDLKPSNIFVTREGVVKILDFGLARLLGSEGITTEGKTPGTVLYMSPEQLRGEEVDARTDIWSFGVILYRMLTGGLPFQADYDQAVIYKILCELPPPLSSLRPEAPEDLAAITDQCLQKDPDHRPQSMTDVLRALDSQAPGGRPRRSGAEWVRHLLLLLAFLVASLVLVLYLARDALSPPPPKHNAPKLAILLFANQTGEREIDIYRAEIQNRFVSNLASTDRIAVEDGLRINDIVKEQFESDNPPRTDDLYAFLRSREYDYVVDGAISRSSQGSYSVQVTCKNTSAYETLHETFTGPPMPKEELNRATESISQEVLAYLNVEVLDVKPEMGIWEPNHRYKNWAAIVQLDRAYGAFLRADRKSARAFLENAISLDSVFVSPRVWLAPSLQDTPAYAAANLSILKRLRGSADDFERAMIDWVEAYDRNDFAEEVRCLNEALRYDSTNRVLLSNLAGAYVRAEDTLRALRIYDRLMRSEWHFPGIYMTAIGYLLARRNYPAAGEALMLWRSVDTSAESSMLFGWLSAFASYRGDSAQARECKEAFVGLCNRGGATAARTDFLLGGCYADFGLYRESADLLQSALRSGQNNPSCHERLAHVLLATGDTTSSLEHLETALRQKSRSRSIHYALGTLYEKRGDARRAQDHYRRYLAQDSTSSAAKQLRQRLKDLHP